MNPEVPNPGQPSAYSRFSAAWLAGWLGEVYDLPGVARCTFISHSLNDTYQVEAGETRAYLRISRQGLRSLADVTAELALVRTLAAANLPVAQPLPRRDGHFAGELDAPEGARAVALLAAAPGESAREISPEQAHAYGRLAAQVHQTATARPPSNLRTLDQHELIARPLQAITDRMTSLGADPDELAYLQRSAQAVAARIAELPRSAPAWGICHGDLHPGNVRFAASGPTLFDFDCFGYGWRAYDLAVFQWNAWLERREPEWIEPRWQAFLAGYRSVATLDESELEAVPLFLVARQVWLAGLDADLSSGYPAQWVDRDWLPATNAPLRTWCAHFPLLSDLLG